jgi:hypothetical protein
VEGGNDRRLTGVEVEGKIKSGITRGHFLYYYHRLSGITDGMAVIP